MLGTTQTSPRAISMSAGTRNRLDNEQRTYVDIDDLTYVRVTGTQEDIPLTPLFGAIPVTGSKSTAIFVKNMDNLTITVALTVGTSSTAICTPEFSIDNINWVPLIENTLSVTPTVTRVGFLFSSVPFEYIRMSFDTIISGGDTFEVDISGKAKL